MDLTRDERLIFLVSKRKELYDRTNEHSKDNVYRDRIWREICEELQVDVESVELIKKRWKNLRDTYLKRKKESLKKSEDDGKPPREWKYMKSMEFLDPYLSFSPPIVTGVYSASVDGEVIELSCSVNEDEQSTSDIATVEESNGIISSKANISTENTSKSTKRKSNDTSSEQAIEHPQDKKSQKWPDKTSEEHFALSLVPVLQRLTHQQNSLARIRIQQVLYEVEFGSENGHTNISL